MVILSTVMVLNGNTLVLCGYRGSLFFFFCKENEQKKRRKKTELGKVFLMSALSVENFFPTSDLLLFHRFESYASIKKQKNKKKNIWTTIRYSFTQTAAAFHSD